MLTSHFLRSEGVRPSAALARVLDEPGVVERILRLGDAMAPTWGTTADDDTSLFATFEASVYDTSVKGSYTYDDAGNATAITRDMVTREYAYGADNRLRGAGTATYAFDHLGRRVRAESRSTFSYPGVGSLDSLLVDHFSYGPGGEMLSWVRKNTALGAIGEEETAEEYVYLHGQPLAKIVTKVLRAQTGDGGGGGGGCCCAATAIAYNGQTQCDLASHQALQVLRGFRGQVLSGNDLGEWIIRFYYRDLSPIAVQVFREYPELREAMNYALRGAAWMLEFWITPAHAAPVEQRSTAVYWYHNGILGEPILLTDESGTIVRHVEHDPFWSDTVPLVNDVDDRFMFPGQFRDDESGLAYNWNRWYAADVGRYVQVDPLISFQRRPPFPVRNELELESSFGYARDNPLVMVDTMGLSACCKSGSCDCPEGKWSGFFAGGMYVGGGVGAEVGVGRLYCLSSMAWFDFKYSCFLVGGGTRRKPLMLAAGASAGPMYCSGAECVENITGSSLGFAISIAGTGLGGVGGAADWGGSGCSSASAGVGAGGYAAMRSCTVTKF